MQHLQTVAQDQLFTFAKDAGLLVAPSQAQPDPTAHHIPAARVLTHEGAVLNLASFELQTTPSFQLRIPNATVLGSNLGIVFGRHLLPGGFSHQTIWAVDGRGNSNRTGSIQIPDIPLVDVPMPTVQMLGFSSHWGHFFTDCLDRVLAASHASELHIPMITDAGGPCDSAMQILLTSGILDAPIEVWPLQKHTGFRVRELYLRTLTSIKPAAPVGSLRLLRERIHARTRPPEPAQALPLFVGRQDVSVRRIAGQSALAQTLENERIADVVFPEVIGAARSIDSFRTHRKILLPIGSAKFNLAFCEPGTQVVCIAPQGYAEKNGSVSQMLRHMCAGLDLRLSFYSCRSKPSAGPRSHMRLHDDLLIDLADIKSMLAVFNA